MKAYTVNFQSEQTGRGRHTKGGTQYEQAIVIAENVIEATQKGEDFRKKHFPKLFMEEIRHENDRVIL